MTLTFFSLLFTATTGTLFFIMKKSCRYALLAIAGIVYVSILRLFAGVAITTVVLAAWIIGVILDFTKRKNHLKMAKFVFVVSVSAIAVMLVVSKLGMAFITTHQPDSRLVYYLMPLGFSFYMFRVISYFADCYTGKIIAEHNLFKLMLYLAWFPAFVSGPIERYERFSRQIENLKKTRLFDSERWNRVLAYLLIGFFYKVVIADRLGIIVDHIFGQYNSLNSLWLILGSLFYTLQVYFDFAGYSYAAIGFSLIFGIDLIENFRIPYFSENITDFWRRWHISLSQWLRDYIYIPLGGNRKGIIRKQINTMIVFLVCGLWHGGDLSFIVWGALHGLYSILCNLLKANGKNKLISGWTGRIMTFILVSFAWIFFRADSLSIACCYIGRILTSGFSSTAVTAADLGLDWWEGAILLISIGVTGIVEWHSYKADCSVPNQVRKMNVMLQYVSAFLIFVVIVIFGVYGPAAGSHLIYMDF